MLAHQASVLQQVMSHAEQQMMNDRAQVISEFCILLGSCSATGSPSIAVRLGDQQAPKSDLSKLQSNQSAALMEQDRVSQESEHYKELVEFC